MKVAESKIIDEIFTEIRDKNILNEIVCISLTKEALQELKDNYTEEFKNEMFESGRKTSVRDLEEYFGVQIVVSTFKEEGKKYVLLTKI